MNGAYYNDSDPYCAEWLRNLIAKGHIAPGEVDTRSICDVAPDDLRGFAQVHLFAGIGGWSYALRLAGWPDDRSVWTGSCPCQPFSAAGKRKGAADERHLWPEMYRLVAECRPERIFGEQVEAAVRLGWIDGVFTDLAREDYACGFAVLGAHSVGAPHIRQRIYWVADAKGIWQGRDTGKLAATQSDRIRQISRQGNRHGRFGHRSTDDRLADANGGIAGHRGLQPGGEHGQLAQDGCIGDRLADAERDTGNTRRLTDEPGEGAGAPPAGPCVEPGRCGMSDGGMGDTECATEARQRRFGAALEPKQETRRSGNATPWSSGESIRLHDTASARQQPAGEGAEGEARDEARLRGPECGRHSGWGSTYIPCADGKARRVEPGIQPLAHGISARVGKLRAAGNAIVPQVAAEFIRATELTLA